MENLLTEATDIPFPKHMEMAQRYMRKHTHTYICVYFFIALLSVLCGFQLSSSTARKYIPNTCISRHLLDTAGFVCFGCKCN